MNLVAPALLALLLAQAPPAQREGPGVGDCASRPLVLQYLQGRFGLTPQNQPHISQTTQGRFVREDISARNEWVTIMTRRDGITCIMAMGERT